MGGQFDFAEGFCHPTTLQDHPLRSHCWNLFENNNNNNNNNVING